MSYFNRVGWNDGAKVAVDVREDALMRLYHRISG